MSQLILLRVYFNKNKILNIVQGTGRGQIEEVWRGIFTGGSGSLDIFIFFLI